MSQSNHKGIFLEVVESIKHTFPSLQFQMTLEHPHFDALLEIPIQSGVTFGISIYLSGDELLLTVQSFHCEWFPCTNKEVVNDYVEAITGLVSGEYRIVEYSRGEGPFKARLERPFKGKWKGIATWSRPHLPIPWETSTRIVQNVK